MTRKIIRFFAVILCMALLAGCWNRREINELAFVVAIGIDKLQEKEGSFQVSFQVVNPSEVAMQQGSPNSAPVTIYKATGDTIFEALRNASRVSPRRFFVGAVRLFIIGENLAREGIKDLFDLIDRDHEMRRTLTVLIARDTDAETILETLTPLEKIPTNRILNTLEVTEKALAENMKVDRDQVANALISKGREPAISGIRVAGKKQFGEKVENTQEVEPKSTLYFDGIGLFNEGKLVGWLESTKARGFLWTQEKVKNPVVKLDCKDKKGGVVVELYRSKAKIESKIVNKKPIIHISVNTEGSFGETRCAVDLTKTKEIYQIEKKTQMVIGNEILTAIKVAQTKKSDIFGFGEVLHRSQPNEWKKVEKKWSDLFATANVVLDIEVHIRRSGLSSKPYFAE